MEQFKQRLILYCTVFILEICRILVFVFPFAGGGTYDKVTTALPFLVLVFILHLNVLDKHNKGNLWQVNTSFLALFISTYFEESGVSNKYQGTERCSETNRQTAQMRHQCIILHIL
jgi:hypothetical protein